VNKGNTELYKQFKQVLLTTHKCEYIRMALHLDNNYQVYYLVKKGKQDGIIFNPRRGVYYKRVENFIPHKGEQQNIKTAMGLKA